ncbi:TIGR00153 family protein [Methanotorris formicicus]|uniref:Putative phosphate transport regulator n=1 Tax=Methanotorris formicicus Mc-S-70 TaxID=647171 RepID=H1KZM0_9EURY|nr:TIGR00153 family protein [Methanotorris formicicus]EHP85761.1 putative phosphate transport regulator [Methanotorris formicicus Mc-S-70]
MSIFFFKRKPEREVIEFIKYHIGLSKKAIAILKEFLDNKDKEYLNEITSIEKEGDEIRKKAILKLYEAFLPSMRRELNYSIEILDEVLDSVNHGAKIYDLMTFELDNNIKEKCKLVLDMSIEMLDCLINAVNAFEERGDFNECIKIIKMREEEIDDIHHEIYRYMVNMEINNFWEGKLMSDLVDMITNISDLIEDVANEFQVIYLS